MATTTVTRKGTDAHAESSFFSLLFYYYKQKKDCVYVTHFFAIPCKKQQEITKFWSFIENGGHTAVTFPSLSEHECYPNKFSFCKIWP